MENPGDRGSPSTIEDYQHLINKLYDSECLCVIYNLLSAKKSYTDFTTHIKNSVFFYSLTLYQQDSDSAADIKKQINSAATKLEEAQRALKRLGGSALEAIALAFDVNNPMESNNIWRSLEPPGATITANTRISTTLLILRDAENCVRGGLNQVSAVKPPGRPSNDAESKLITCLIVIWKCQTGSEPTARSGGEGPFTEFCRAVIDPIWRYRGKDAPKLSGQVQRILYPGPGN